MKEFQAPPQELMLSYAKHYLASGGPTSRLEESLGQWGKQWGYETEVFATPTGVFLNLKENGQEGRTHFVRIKETGTDLGRLCRLEELYAKVLRQETKRDEALLQLQSPSFSASSYSPLVSAGAAFLSGMAICYDAYQRPSVAVIAGFITALIWFLTAFSLKRLFGNPIFIDFTGAFLTLVLAALAHGLWSPIAMEAYAIGGIVLLVPGLALTTAIAEIADQNLVSGTAKFMQAALAILALGLAYLLFQQLAFSLNLRGVLQPVAVKSSVQWVSFISVGITIVCFGVIFKVPPRELLGAAFTGLLGWICLQALAGSRAAAAAPFLAAVVVGTVSLTLGRFLGQPSQVYSVPGIVAMLPGMLALNSFRYFASGDSGTGVAFSAKVAITAVSIVFGLMTARIPFTIGRATAKVTTEWLRGR